VYLTAFVFQIRLHICTREVTPTFNPDSLEIISLNDNTNQELYENGLDGPTD